MRRLDSSTFARVAAWVLLAGAVALLPDGPGRAQQRGAQAADDRKTWTDYGGGPDNARYLTLSQITRRNVKDLEIAWTYPTRDDFSYVFNPLIVGNVIYVLGRNSALVALNATTGEEIWVHENLQGIAPRGINYWESKDRKDRRLLYQRNHYLEAIDAVTGKPILSFGDQGAVNLRAGFGKDPATVGRVQSSTPGKIFENLILLGSATGENYMATPGDLRAYDVVTGAEVWRFHTIPHPGEFGYETWPKDAYKYVGGTNTWGEITVDPKRGIAYFPTGSPTYDYYGADRKGANLFGTSLLALDARTGRRLWHFQMVHHDLWDFDNCAAPQLTTIRRNGKTIDVVAQAGKTGFLYVFDRVTGQPIWPIEERPVPASDIPGEQAWPTQPFPTAPPPFAAQRLTADDVNPHVLTPAERDEWKRKIANARNDGLFTPPALIDTIAIPGANGGANWGNTAAHPYNGTVYVQSINVPSIYRLSLEQPGRGGGGGRGASAAVVAQGQGLYTQRCQSCHGPDLRGTGTLPSLVGVTARLSPDALREVISGGRQAMPPFRDLSNGDMEALIAFLGNAPAAGRGAGAAGPPKSFGGPVVASGGAPGAKPAGRGSFGMIGPDYPAGLDVPPVRYYTGYGLSNTIVKPPYSTLTAYDLNSGTIRWQVPAGDEPKALAQGVQDTGVMSQRSGMITTSTGLLFHAGGDAKVRAHDVETGKVLWTGDLPGGSRGVPAMFEVGGRQFLVVNATQGPVAATGAAGPRGYVAFALKK
ncbi:MAG TPA: PQQ-binding-like beta-propeller repeat protein [Vicinamibacterales bacterium]|nr:PQQ-binding-like beta-propeller repeat protein [Vicinamibacterales bacterium]